MSDDPQIPYPQVADAQPSGAQPSSAHHRLAGAIDPRKAIEPATVERMIHAQVAARAQAQAATTIVLATIVSLITSAFSFVAALAWNTAIQQLLKENLSVDHKLFGLTLSQGGIEAVYALIVTIIAVIVVVILNRIAKRMANKSALGAN